MASSAQNLPKEPPRRPLALRWRVLISLALVAHLTAVIAAPMALPPSSVLQQDLANALRPYLDVLYLDHGYRFFAPAPGPSHLVRYTLEALDGAKSQGTFPDKQSEWPRLFYHRHFMLSEKLYGLLPPELPTGLPAEIYNRRSEALEAFQKIVRSYAEHLLRESGAARVRIELVEHLIPFPEQVANQGRRLDDHGSYVVLWQGTFDGSKP